MILTTMAARASALLLSFAAQTSLANGPEFRLPEQGFRAFSGKSVLAQSSGNDVSRFEYAASVLHIASRQEGRRGLTVVRHLHDPGDGEEMATIDRYRVQAGDDALRLEPAGRVPFEMQGKVHMVNVYLPAVTVPTFSVPDPGTSEKSKAQLTILNLGRVEAELRVSSEATEAGLVVRRSASSDAEIVFDFRGSPARVTRYEERYALDQAGELAELEIETRFEFTPAGGGEAIKLERTASLERSAAAPLVGDDTPAWAALLPAAAAVEKALDDRLPSAETEKLLSALGPKTAGTPLVPLARALQVRFTAFAPFFEATPQGKVLAKVLGRSAPDFELKDLDGKDYAFRARTRGKLVLLSFWAYG